MLDEIPVRYKHTKAAWEGDCGAKFEWFTSERQGASWYWDSLSFDWNRRKEDNQHPFIHMEIISWGAKDLKLPQLKLTC
jgi:hypothetical protein